MNLCDTLFYGDTLLCQILYDYVKGHKAVAHSQIHVKNPINLTLRSKVTVVPESRMCATYPLMVIDPCAKYDMTMSKANRSFRSDTRTYKKPNKFVLEVKGQCHIKINSWMYATHRFIWWYVHVLNMVSYCWTKKSYGPDTNLHRKTNSQCNSITYWTLLKGGCNKYISTKLLPNFLTSPTYYMVKRKMIVLQDSRPDNDCWTF